MEEIDFEYCRASSGKRLANYVIDLIAFYAITFFIGAMFEIAMPGSISTLNIDSTVERLINMFFYGLVMFVIELVFQGKSLGKLITGTKAITRNGETPTFSQFLGRNFVRAIPFNAISGLGTPCSPWHDNWSNTIVVNERVLNLQLKKDVFFAELKNQTQ